MLSNHILNRGSQSARKGGYKISIICAAYIFFWVLFYVEPIQLGPIKISQLWKGALCVALSIIVFRKNLPSWYVVGLLLCLEILIYTSFPKGFIEAISEALELLLFYSSLLFVLVWIGRDERKITAVRFFSLYVSVFFLFSALPFLILDIPSLQPVRDLSRWGLDMNATTGIFYSIQPASQTYLVATLVVLSFRQYFMTNFASISCLLCLIFLGGYLVYFSFARTGWLLFLAGFMFLGLNASTGRDRVLLLIALSISGFTAFILLAQNEAFLLRLAGGAVYRQDFEVGFDKLLASRLPFISVALENLVETGPLSWIFGHGTVQGYEMFEAKTGMAIDSHNGITTRLESHGLIGLCLCLWIYFKMISLSYIGAKNVGTKELLEQVKLSGFLIASSLLISRGLPLTAELCLVGILASAMAKSARDRAFKVEGSRTQ